MASNSPKILTFEFDEVDLGTEIKVRFGQESCVKMVPKGFGLHRVSAILNDEGKLTDVETIWGPINFQP